MGADSKRRGLLLCQKYVCNKFDKMRPIPFTGLCLCMQNYVSSFVRRCRGETMSARSMKSVRDGQRVRGSNSVLSMSTWDKCVAEGPGRGAI